MIYNRGIGAQLLGCLFQKPDLLSQTDDYLLTLDDFPERLPRMIFGHLYNLYHSGMNVMDVSTFVSEISKYPEQMEFFEANNGEQFVVASIEKGELHNFDFYYNRIKKLSLLRDLANGGFDIREWYVEELFDIREREALEARLDESTVHEIIQTVQQKMLNIESRYINKSSFTVSSVADGLETLVERLGAETAIGLPMNGAMLSTLLLGARSGKVYSMSGEQGAGKSRYAIANACKMAFPILWDEKNEEWANTGSNQKVMFVTTELLDDEVQSIVLAYVSGISEDRILTDSMSKKERARLAQTINLLNYYEDNFYIFQIPDPNVQQIKVNLRRYAMNYNLDAVFYDYIHTSPSLLSEFSGARIREDVALMLLSTALKEIANEQDLFIWTGTQVNGTIEPGELADVGVIRGL